VVGLLPSVLRGKGIFVLCHGRDVLRFGRALDPEPQAVAAMGSRGGAQR